MRRFLAASANVNAGDEEGRTAAHLAATYPINDKENPCLNVLIDEGHAVFLSKHATHNASYPAQPTVVLFSWF